MIAPILILQDEKQSSGTKKTFENRKKETSFLDFETFVSTQKISYFGPDLEFGMFKIVL